MKFADILGHQRALEMLAQAQQNDRVHHAYLFAGPAGIGKRRVAYAWMARLACLAPGPDGDACAECRNCRRILGHPDWYDQNGPWKPPPPEPNAPLTPIHPDVATLVPYGPQIRIEQVREVRRIAHFPPVELPFRFILIDPADALNEAAANALLKTLEEPPSQTRFILLSESPTSLLVTIRSRCQRVDFHRLSEGDVDRIVARVMPDVAPEQRARAARIAHGSAALALALVDDPVLQAWMPIARRIAAAVDPSLGTVLDFAQQMADLGAADRAFEFIIRLLRDALLVRVGSGEPIFHQELSEEVQGFAARHSVDGLLHRIRIAEDTRQTVATFNAPALLGCERLLLEVIGRDGAEEGRPVMSSRSVL